jgi:hypothetical protein
MEQSRHFSFNTYRNLFFRGGSARKGIVGIFVIKSGRREKIIDRNDGPWYYYEIAPLLLANKGQKPREVVMKDVVGHHLKPMGIVFELKPLEYGSIKSVLLRMENARE